MDRHMHQTFIKYSPQSKVIIILSGTHVVYRCMWFIDQGIYAGHTRSPLKQIRFPCIQSFNLYLKSMKFHNRSNLTLTMLKLGTGVINAQNDSFNLLELYSYVCRANWQRGIPDTRDRSQTSDSFWLVHVECWLSFHKSHYLGGQGVLLNHRKLPYHVRSLNTSILGNFPIGIPRTKGNAQHPTSKLYVEL